MKVKSFSCVRLFVTLWTVAHQGPPFMGFSRQEYWIGLPFPSLGDLPNPGIKPRSPSLQENSLPSEPQGSPIQGYKAHFLPHSFVHLFQHHLLQRYMFLCWITLIPLLKTKLTINVWAHFWPVSSSIELFVFLPVPHWFDYCSFFLFWQ